MAFSEAERAAARKWLGYPAAYLINRPALENAITVVQSLADGGQRADNSTEILVRGYLTQLASIETKIQGLFDSAIAAEVDEVKVDFPRAVASLRSVGRQYVGHIADALGVSPMRDVFSPSRSVM